MVFRPLKPVSTILPESNYGFVVQKWEIFFKEQSIFFHKGKTIFKITFFFVNNYLCLQNKVVN